MSPSLGHPSVERRLQQRADALHATPLLEPERSLQLRAEMRAAARRESFSIVRRQRTSFLLGLAAAALLLLAVPKFLALPMENFGAPEIETAMLDAGGRVVQSGGALRSGNTQANAKSNRPVYLDLYVEHGAFINLRVQTSAGWQPLLDQDNLELLAGEEAQPFLPENVRGSSILIVTSERPIPTELLERNLERFGWQALPERLGCRVELHALGSPGPTDD